MTDFTALRLYAARLFLGRRLRAPRLRSRYFGLAFTGLLLIAPALAILYFWQHNAVLLEDGAPPVVGLEKLEIVLSRGETATVGRRELLQPQRSDAAETRHLAVSRLADGKLVLRNVAATRRLWIDYADGTGSFSARWKLEAGDRIAAGPLTVTVEEANDDRLVLALAEAGKAARKAVVEGGGVSWSVGVDGTELPVCQNRSFADVVRRFITGMLAADDRGEETVLQIGGRLTCSVREDSYVAAGAIPFRSLAVTARGGSFFLAPGDSPDAPRPPVTIARGQQRVADFAGIAWEVEPAGKAAVDALIIGRTRYRVDVGPEDAGKLVMTLTPVSKAFRFDPVEGEALKEASTSDEVRPFVTPPRQPMSKEEVGNPFASLNGVERLIRLLLTVGLGSVAMLAAMKNALSVSRRPSLFGLSGAIASCGLIGVTTLLVLAPDVGRIVGANVPYADALRSTILAYGVASIPILIGARFTTAFRLIWIGLLLLCCLGSLTLLSLAIDSEKTDFAIHAEKNKLLFFDIIPVLAVAIATQAARSVEAMPRSFFTGVRPRDQLLRALPAFAILGAFAMWAAVGTETGVAGFQPVELGKVALVFVLAHIFLGFSRIEHFYSQRNYISWLSVSLATVIIFLLFLTAIPFLKSDYSPALIIVITAIVLAFAFLLPSTLKRLVKLLGVFLRRADAPQPRIRRLGWPRGGTLALWLLGLLALNAVVIVAFPSLVTYAVAGRWSLPHERGAAIDTLEQARGGPLRVPAERLLTWYDLDHSTVRTGPPQPGAQPDVVHRDLGFQLLQSKVALAEAPCVLTRIETGVDHLQEKAAGAIDRLPAQLRTVLAPLVPADDALCALAPDARRTAVPDRPEADQAVRTFTVKDLVRIPVVQNDFIATFLMVRFGLPAALLLLFAEFLTVTGLVLLALDLMRDRARGSSLEGARQGMAIVLIGVATIFTLHWSISWGNAIGLLPVMGQPMTFIAAATSHHMLMVLPSVAVALLAGRLAAIEQRAISTDPPAWGVLRGLART